MKDLSRVAAAFVFFFILAGTVGIFSATSIFAAEKIDINSAPLEDLIKIIHVGEGRALELISLRPFSSLDDLARINGIGEKRVEDIKKQGSAWVSNLAGEASPRPIEEKPQSYPSGIVFNEILPNTSVGLRDEEGEYIELFNQNSLEVNLTGWKIEDTAGRTTAYVFPENTKIGPLGFLVFYRPTTKITLNNDGDGLNLIQPDGKIIDSVSYEKAPRGQSYNRTPSGWAWSTILTPGSENVVPAQKAKEETEGISVESEPSQTIDINAASLEELQKITGTGPVLAQKIIDTRPFYSIDEMTKVSGIGPKTLEEIKRQGLAWVDPELEPPEMEETEPTDKGLAAVAQPLKQEASGREIPKSLSLFLIALALAVFSGATVLILKRRLKTKDML